MRPAWRTVRIEVEERADWDATIEIARVAVPNQGLPRWLWTVERYPTLFGQIGASDNLRDIKK